MRFVPTPRRFATRVTALFLLCFTMLVTSTGMAASARQSEDENQVGPVETLAVDSSGNGWAWAESAPQTPGTNYLLRIQDGKWSVAEDTTTAPDLLPMGVTMIKMVLTANGSDGWAVGRTAERFPLLWRYRNGAWKTVRFDVPQGARIAQGMTINAAGTDGWMSLYDQFNDRDVLFRLRNGAWTQVPQVNGGSIVKAAISPDGRSGWASGRYGASPKEAIYRLENGAWVSPPVAILGDNQVVIDITADNTGHGWAIVSNSLESGSLIRLGPAGTTVVYDTAEKVSLSEVAVDATGRGWALGAKDLGQIEEPGGFEYLRETVVLRLDGDSATELKPSEAAFNLGDVGPRSLAITPDGAHAWAGARTSIDYGRVIEFREPWVHGQADGGKGPEGAPPFTGRGRCFAEVKYCLRGKFLAFWETNGGIDQLGLPVTTEVSENIGGKMYVVQYTERARLEYHPENTGKAGEVLLGLLGNTLADARQSEAPFIALPLSGDTGGLAFFPQTGHSIQQPFLAYWQSKGGLPVFGYPRSEAFTEQNQANGKSYLVQYFERNRIEHHPENQGTKFEFLLGLLGIEQFKATYGFVP